jgi:hypothetical protein
MEKYIIYNQSQILIKTPITQQLIETSDSAATVLPPVAKVI